MNDGASPEEAAGLVTDYPLLRIGRRVLQVLAGVVILFGFLGLVVDAPGSNRAVLESASFLELLVRLFGIAMQAFLLALGAELLGLFSELIDRVRALSDGS